MQDLDLELSPGRRTAKEQVTLILAHPDVVIQHNLEAQNPGNPFQALKWQWSRVLLKPTIAEA